LPKIRSYMNNQKILDETQLSAFYHDYFVRDQFNHFKLLVAGVDSPIVVIVDVGGGCGYFISKLNIDLGFCGRVMDSDPISVEECLANGIDAELGDALQPEIKGDEDLVCFNLILHHLVADSEEKTKKLQIKAIESWKGRAKFIFIDEYIYESMILDLSGRLIYEITKSQVLSFLGKMVSYVVPSLRANTFGVGVRFRSNKGWTDIFDSMGFKVVNFIKGAPEPVSFARRLLLIRECRRDSFLLTNK